MSFPPANFCIITPSFNTRRYIGQCIESLLAQDYPQLNYVVMDGGSTDGTADLLKTYGDRIRWVSQKDGGQSDAINRGFAMTGAGNGDEILGWLNSDDTYAPGALAHIAEVFARNPAADVVYGLADYIDARGKHISRCTHIEPFSRHRLLYYSDFIVQPATFFRRRAFEAAGGVNVALNWMMDWDLWIKFARAGLRFVHTPRLLAHFRWIAENKTASGGVGRLDEIDINLARYGLPRPAYVELERCNLNLAKAAAELAHGRIGAGMRSLGQIATSLARSPRAVRSLLEPRTWNVIWTGQVLRARALAAERRRQRDEG